ncbi:MAG: DUF11 domain-containing protein [Planctomycetia bacterium]|nr:DUF11 domain-containing protein [Planctomycetia bacterium]
MSGISFIKVASNFAAFSIKNDDIFLADEMWAARKTPKDKQFNYMHNEKDIIGHITGNYVVDFNGELIPDDADPSDLPNESFGQAHVAERAAELQAESAQRKQGLAEAVGFDVPTTWTRLTSANAVINEQVADVVSASQGTATLRVESPGRAELTLCKRAGNDSARVGEELDFTIAFLNSGDVPLTDVVIVDTLPGRLELIADSPAASLPAEISLSTADDGSRVISWKLQDTLEAGKSGFVRLRTVVR